MIKITCLGAAGSVTGSCFVVEGLHGKKIMVDCGMFQGGNQIEQRNYANWDFNPKEIETLFLTHAHIDHSGRIPKFVKDGFRGKIICSRPTADLCQIMLLDSAHVQEMDAQWKTKKNMRRLTKNEEPLYTSQDAEFCQQFFTPMDEDEIINLEGGFKARLRESGHILGSCILELWAEDEGKEVKIVFSGDIGQKSQLIVKDPCIITDANYVFVESTYGDRIHKSFDESKAELLAAINHAVSHNEKVIIPAFAVERTQELLYLLGEFLRDGKLPDIPIYLDSPLAIKATEIFGKYSSFFDPELIELKKRGIDPFTLPNLKCTLTSDESKAINSIDGPAIVIAGSGMCNAGRIKHHIKHNIWRPGASMVIVGFQALGTPGRQIVEGKKWIKILRETVAVRAKVFTIGGFSAHADQKDLLSWISNFREAKPRIFVIHGEAASSETLADMINKNFKLSVHVPRWKEKLVVGAKGALTEAEGIVADDINKMAIVKIGELETEIERIKTILRTKGSSEEDIDRLRNIREELQFVMTE